MENTFKYDEFYYKTYTIPYDEKEHWEKFFGLIADRIVKDIGPTTVLDAGCASGYLVAALRDRGVSAYGIDISDYAISKVREDIKPYCKVGSIIEPLDKKYDLIISIEVIEHLSAKDGRLAIENLCKFTEDFIFTSTPTGYGEPSHFNVNPTYYWAKIFASCGFIRDVDFDCSFLTDYAIRFKKTKENISEIVCQYERAYYLVDLENKSLRSELINAQRSLENNCKYKSEKEDELQSLISERDRIKRELEDAEKSLENYKNHYNAAIGQRDDFERRLLSSEEKFLNKEKELENIKNSRGYKLLLKYYKFKSLISLKSKL